MNDEAQRCPSLYSYLQTRVDLDGRSGLFVLTGSQQFGLLSKITQSLAGRVAVIELLPFSLEELEAARVAPKDIDDLLFEGMYPPVRAKGLDPSPWFANYVMTYVERGEDLHAYEIKSGKTVSADYFRRLKRFSAIASGARVRPEVIYAGEEESTRDGIPVRPWRALPKAAAASLR